jgi:hypothetical protein
MYGNAKFGSHDRVIQEYLTRWQKHVLFVVVVVGTLQIAGHMHVVVHVTYISLLDGTCDNIRLCLNEYAIIGR